MVLLTFLSATVVQLALGVSFAPFAPLAKANPLNIAPNELVAASSSFSNPSLATAAITATATNTATATATASLTNSLPLTASASITDLLATLTTTVPLTIPLPISDTSPITPATNISTTQAITTTDAITSSDVVAETGDDSAYSSIISGTIIANRTEQQALFFVEGATYLLDPLRSIGLQLPRGTAAVNLFNCDARTAQNQADCFWDPYLLKSDGFYEIVSGSDAGKVVSLVLREVGTPATDKVFVQNRTGKSETVYISGQEIAIPSASVHEFQVQPDTPILIYMQSCVTVADQEACEWAPRTAKPGAYYALIEVTDAGSAPNSQHTSLELQEVLIAGGEPAIPTPPQVTCTTQVPSLNVRSGPGLQYTIIQKVRINGSDPAKIIAIGRDQDSQWLAVDDRIAPGGWVIASGDFVRCEGDIAALPVTQPTVAELQPTPAQPEAQPQTQEQTANTDTSGTSSQQATDSTPQPDQTAAEPTPTSAGVPAGYALITVNNGFDKQVRFTLDQQYRRDIGPSEFDLEPGGSVQIVVIPGQIAFSVSSPWSGLSKSADFFLDKDQSKVMWVTFVLDGGEWVLRY
ncbi:MAG: hypothetical protein U0175_03900 [Caldilineaceae bacterium]